MDVYLAATLVELGQLGEARAEVKAALALDPNFTLRRYRDAAQSDNPVCLKGRADNRRYAQGRGAGGMKQDLKAACGSGCDARRLSTGRSIRA